MFPLMHFLYNCYSLKRWQYIKWYPSDHTNYPFASDTLDGPVACACFARCD
jgi:hypothetical protein